MAAQATARAAALAGTVSAAGWAVLALAVAALWLGLAYGWAEFTAVAVAAVALLALAALFLLGRSRYEVTLGLASQRVRVGEGASGRVTVRNKGTASLLPTHIELPVGAGLARLDIPRLGSGALHEELFTIPTTRRAVVPVGPVRSVRGDPLGLFRREVHLTDAVDLYVHPRTVPLGEVTAGFLRDLDGRPVREMSDSDMSFHAVRDYVVGDDRRAVHWRSTARAGKLMVRQHEETRSWKLSVALSTQRSDYADADEFELAVSVAASVGAHAFAEGRAVVLRHQRGTLRAGSARQLLDGLSAVEAQDRPGRFSELAHATAAAAPDASIITLVCGSAVTPTELRAAHARTPLGATVVAVRCALGQQATRRSIGDLPVLSVGELVQLPRALRSVAP